MQLPETENVSVHEVIVESALGFAPALAVRLVPKLVGPLSRSSRGMFRQKIADLIVALAEE